MKTFKIKELGKVVGGSTPSTKVDEYFGGDISWITPKDLSGYNKKYIYSGERNLTLSGFNSTSVKIVPKDTILFSSRAPIGYVAISGQELCTNQGFKNIIVNENVDFMYLYYAMKYNTKKIESIASGTSYKEVSGSVLSNFEMTIHKSLKEQKVIADTLSALDNKIEINNKINKNLEQQAQSIFKHWFIDFEFPDENGKPYKSSGGEMVGSELGMIPNGWEIKSLDEIADFLNGTAIAKHKPKTEANETLPAIKIREMRQGFTDDSSDRCLISVDDKYFVNDYDMLFAWSGSLLIDTWVGGIAILNQHLFKVTSDKYDQWFYYYWSKYFLDEFIQIAKNKATTMGHINRSHLSDSKVLLPENKIYKEMSSIFKSILDLKMKNRKQNQTLSQLRDTLLPILMSGEIRIPLD